MTEGVCHPAATLARKFESLAGLLASSTSKQALKV